MKAEFRECASRALLRSGRTGPSPDGRLGSERSTSSKSAPLHGLPRTQLNLTAPCRREGASPGHRRRSRSSAVRSIPTVSAGLLTVLVRSQPIDFRFFSGRATAVSARATPASCQRGHDRAESSKTRPALRIRRPRTSRFDRSTVQASLLRESCAMQLEERKRRLPDPRRSKATSRRINRCSAETPKITPIRSSGRSRRCLFGEAHPSGHRRGGRPLLGDPFHPRTPVREPRDASSSPSTGPASPAPRARTRGSGIRDQPSSPAWGAGSGRLAGYPHVSICARGRPSVLSVVPVSWPSWSRSPLRSRRCRRPPGPRPRGFAIRSRRR
jgi:hypothetical protein